MMGQGGQDKLDAPENVQAEVQGDELLVSWDLVEDAEGYQVEYSLVMADGSLHGDESVFVEDTTALVPVTGAQSVMVKVRATEGPPNAQASEAAGQKGAWSDSVTVDIPPPEAAQLPMPEPEPKG